MAQASDERGLTSGERALSRNVFGDAIDLDPVRVHAGGANPIGLVAGGLWDFSVRRPLTLARLVPEAAMLPWRLRRATATATRRSGGNAAEAVEDGGDAAQTTPIPGAAPFTAPRTRFNATITPHRAVRGTSLDLTEMKEVKNAFGVTVNDVVVPVSTRGDEGTQGNDRVTVLFASLGTDIQDPLERLRAVARRTRRGKRRARGGMRPGLIQDVATLAPSGALSLVMRLYGDLHLADLHPVVHNLSVSNFPGPRKTPDFLGARVTHMYPLGPLMHGSGLSVTAMSLGDRLDVGINACEHLVPDPGLIATGLRESMDRLLELTRETAAGAGDAGATVSTPPGSTTTEEG